MRTSMWLGIVALAGVFAAGAQDPDGMLWSTFLGGADAESSNSITIDSQGYIWTCGSTFSTDFPMEGASFDNTYNGTNLEWGGPPYGGDLSIVKIDPTTGQIVYSTFIGGSGDEETDQILVDATGRVLIHGTTFSTDFPTTLGAYDRTHGGNGQSDLFLLRLNAAGNALEFSTFVGGSAYEDSWSNGGLLVDGSGSIYFSGHTFSSDVPDTLNGFSGGRDGIIVKMNSNGTAVDFVRYFGGDVNDWLLGMSFAANGDLLITGNTSSTETTFPIQGSVYDPTANGSRDSYVARLTNTGNVIFCTFLGGSDFERSYTVKELTGGDLIVVGETRSTDFPLGPDTGPNAVFDATPNGDFDYFVARLTGDGSALVASTVIGGGARDTIVGAILDANETIWIGGESRSANFPVTRGAFDISFNGGDNDCIVAAIDSSLQTLVYSTFLGGFAKDWSVYLAREGNYVYATGTAWSENFPTRNAYDDTFGGDGLTLSDGFAAKLDIAAPTRDTDLDGMPNWWEKLYALNPNQANGGADTDADGLTHLQEFTANTNPIVADEDGDGLNDGAELALSTDPKQKDTDLDGMSDREETMDLDAGTAGVQNPFDPNDADSTGDSGGGPDSVGDGNNDYDGDGITNKIEFRDGTNPADVASYKLHPAKTLQLINVTKIVTGTPSMSPFELEWSHNGQWLAYTDFATNQRYRVKADGSAAPENLGTGGTMTGMAWGYDDNSLWHADDVTGNRLVEAQINPASLINQSATIAPVGDPSLTERSGTNFLGYRRRDDGNIEVLPINPQGLLGGIYEKTRLTNVPFDSGEFFSTPRLSVTGDKLALGYEAPGTQVLLTMVDLLSIIHRPELAPVTLADSRLKTIDGSAEYKTGAVITSDGETVIYAKDVTGNYPAAFGITDFDIIYAPADGSGTPTVLPWDGGAPAGNQGIVRISNGGVRVAFIDDSQSTPGTFDIYVARLESKANVAASGTPAPAGQNGAANDGIDDLVITEATVVTDESSTLIDIPVDTVIDFPSPDQSISLSTPTEPVPPAQLPAGITKMPIVRDFGPDGTTFFPYISVTITYTDAEIGDTPEQDLQVYTFNSTTMMYEAVPMADIIIHDLDQNTITFKAYHFSQYGVGGPSDTDGDGITDDVDTDDDNDGIVDEFDPYPLDSDNDGVNNDADSDDDGDGIVDNSDTSLNDTDNDGITNDIDIDDDADGIDDLSDLYPFDTDNDGIRNDVDTDDDGDGYDDSIEGSGDPDGDGIPNRLDTDSDDDGYTDAEERIAGTDPYDANDSPANYLPLAAWPLLLALLAAGWATRTRMLTRDESKLRIH